MRTAVVLFTVVIVVGLHQESRAFLITSNPGAVGLMTNSIVMDITDDFKAAVGNRVEGQSDVLDLVLSDHKHIVSPADTAWLARIVLTWQSGPNPTSLPDLRSVGLSDEFGTVFRTADPLSIAEGIDLVILTGDFADGPAETFHDIHFEFTLPSFDGIGPEIGVVNVEVTNVDGQFEVGEWGDAGVVPEPSAYVVWCLGLTIGGGYWWRCRRG